MKRSALILISMLLFTFMGTVSCEEEEPWISIKGIETQIYNEIKAHRTANGKEGPFVHQPIIVKEAQIFSAKMAIGAIPVGTDGINEHWTIIHDKIGGYNDLTLIATGTNVTAAEIVAAWKGDSAINAAILGDFTQCGAGVEYDSSQVAYVTVMMMKVDS